MKAKVRLPKSVRVAAIRAAKIGDSFVVDGHQMSASSTFMRDGLDVAVNRAWLVRMSSNAKPVAVTVITVTGLRC